MGSQRVAALYDIHGNIDALEAVLNEVAELDVDGLVIGGDFVPGPFPVQALDRLFSLATPVRFLQGNGDRVVLRHLAGLDIDEVSEAFRSSVRWNASLLSESHRAAMSAWPPTVTMEIDGLGRVLFCHATPRNDTEIFTADTPEEALLHVFAGVEADLVVCGHTHMQFDRRIGQMRVVNAGSIGMPFGEPGAYWLLLGAQVEFRRTKYDVDAAAKRILASGSPVAETVAEAVRAPRPEAEMRALYTQAGLKTGSR